VDHTIDEDYEELSEQLFGEGNCYSSSEVRKRMYGMKAVIDAVERDGAPDITDQDQLNDLAMRTLELKKEQQKYFDQRNALNKMVRDQARQEELREILTKSVQSGNLPQLSYTPHPMDESDNDLLVSLNDIHYGANINNYWNTYNSEVCREMLCRYLDRILEIARLHGSERCIVWANGDAISGNIHESIAITNKENVIEQIKGVSELIAEFLAELSSHFREVIYVSVAGNHSRLTPNKNKALLNERLDDLVEWYLDARLQNFENITFDGGEKVDETMYLLDVRGKIYCGIHGDFDGSDAKIQTLQVMAERPVYAVLSGHKHHNKIDEVQGIKTVMAGSFLGMDEFCVKKRIVGQPEQMVLVCNADGILCAYDVPLR
jgi:hypothetical protein